MHPERSSCQRASAVIQTEPIDRVLLGDQKFEQAGEPAAETVRRVIYLNGIALLGDVKVVEAIP
jgi:hypothetical protein